MLRLCQGHPNIVELHEVLQDEVSGVGDSGRGARDGGRGASDSGRCAHDGGRGASDSGRGARDGSVVAPQLESHS